jgi:hypothetical protein
LSSKEKSECKLEKLLRERRLLESFPRGEAASSSEVYVLQRKESSMSAGVLTGASMGLEERVKG